MDSFAIKKIPVRSHRARSQRSDSSAHSHSQNQSRNTGFRSRRRHRGESTGSHKSNFTMPKMPSFPKFKNKQILILIGLVLIAIGIIFVILKMYSLYSKVNINGGITPVKKKEENHDELTVLIAGYGGPKHDGTFLTDTLILAHINKKTHKVMLFSVPRDLWVKVPSTDEKDEIYAKINSLYVRALSPNLYPYIPEKYQGEGKAQNILKDALEDITGLHVDYFVGVDFDAFEQTIDALGGITVNVAKTFDDYYYPMNGKEDDTCGWVPKPTQTEDQLKESTEKYEKMSEEEKKAYDERPISELSEEEFQKLVEEHPEDAYPCRYEHLHFTAGEQTMDGETALKFARSRKSLQDGGDFARAARQQKVIEAVKDKMLSIGFIPKILPLMDTLSDNIRTDIPLSEIQTLLGEAPSAGQYKVSNYVLSTEEALDLDVSSDGQSILVSKQGQGKWSDTHRIVKNVLNGITPTLTPKPTLRVTKTPAKGSTTTQNSDDSDSDADTSEE